MKLRTWLLVLEAALFVYAGICCFSLVSFIAEDFGSKFALFARYLPYTLMNIIPIHLLLVLHFALHPYSLKHKRWMLILNGAFICLGGFLMALLTAVYSFKGTYSSIVMGGITSLYPLDALILGLLYSFLGFALYFYGLKKYQGKNDRFPDPKPRRVWRILIGIFGSLFLLTALFFMDQAVFLSAVNELAESKGISKEAVVEALKDSLQKAYIKYLGGGDDAVVKVDIDLDKGTIEIAQIKKVVKDVQDDYLEVSEEDANEGLKKAKYKEGDDFAIPCPVEDFSKVTAMAFPSEKEAKDIAEKRALAKQAQAFAGNSGVSANDFYSAVAAGTNNDVNVVIKADTDGSAQALKASLEKLSTDKIKVKVLLAQAGAISDSDVLLASASHALIYGFNVRPDARVRQKAEEEHVEIHLHQIIYELLDEMKAALAGKVKVEKVEQVTGQAEIRHLYKISKIGTVAGSYVTSGLLKADEKVRLLRSGVIVYDGKLASLKRFKDDVKEVKEGYECGLTIANFNDLKEGDVVEGYELVEKK